MEYTTIQKTADRWGVSKAHVHKLCQEGRIPGVVYENRHWRVPVDAEKPVSNAVVSGFLSASEMARRWGLKVEKVMWMCQVGAIPDAKRGNKSWLIPQNTVNPLEGYLLISDLVKKWGVNRSLIAKFCKEGRIPGAKQVGQNWYIPADAQKPADRRSAFMPGYISTTKAAEKWGTSRSFVWREAKEGRIPGAKAVDRCWLIPEDAACPPKEKKPSGEEIEGMIRYASPLKMAEKWGTSPMFVRKAARGGRIPGAMKSEGSGWRIPEDAVYPVAERGKKREKKVKKDSFG